MVRRRSRGSARSSSSCGAASIATRRRAAASSPATWSRPERTGTVGMPLGPRRASGPPDQPGSVGPAQSFNDKPTSRRADVDELLGREAEPGSEVRQAPFRGAPGDPERGRRGADRAPARDICGEGLALALGGPWFLPHDPLPVMRTSVRCATSPRAIRVTCSSNIAALPEGSGECLARENSWACGGEILT